LSRGGHALKTRENLSPTPFSVKSERLQGITVISVQGEMDLATAPPLQQLLDDAVAGDSKIIVDLSGCEFIDSTGIALIVLAFREVGEVEPSMALCGLHGQVLRVLELSGIPDHIPTRDNREHALAALSARAAP
jgi:anti-sigma B factor antagonist